MLFKSLAVGNANLLKSFSDLTLANKSNLGIESRIAMTRSATEKLEGLEGFEKLDIGELYYIGNRKFLDSGLASYRRFAVEGLEWDGNAKQMTAFVEGHGHRVCEIILKVSDGHLVHECECSDCDNYGSCK